MSDSNLTRRAVIRAALAAAPLAAFDWDAVPAKAASQNRDDFDAVITGSGLGGLSCAAAFARKGYRPLVLEQHDRAGGYATAFSRPGGFVLDVSLHSTTVGERNGVRNLIPGFPEITDLEFVSHPYLYRAVFPDHDIRVAQRDLPAYVDQLTKLFPEEQAGIQGLIADAQALTLEIGKLSAAQGRVDMTLFPIEYPVLYRTSNQTWGQMVDARLRDPKLKAIVSSQWVYYGLPPSRLASFYYAVPAIGYLESGGYYPKGRSQTLSNALVKFIEAHGGKVLLNTPVERILANNNTAYGVRCSDGREFCGRVVVSNASAVRTFYELLEPDPEDEGTLPEYKARLESLSTSLSSFQVFLGLNRDLVNELEIPDSDLLRARVRPGRRICGASPSRCRALRLVRLPLRQSHPRVFAEGKEHHQSDRSSRLRSLGEVREGLSGRPEDGLPRREGTHGRHPHPARGRAVLARLVESHRSERDRHPAHQFPIHRKLSRRHLRMGPDRGQRRKPPIGHATPVNNLYLAGAWTRPGHGYGAVHQSGLECFGEIVRDWA